MMETYHYTGICPSSRRGILVSPVWFSPLYSDDSRAKRSAGPKTFTRGPFWRMVSAVVERYARLSSAARVKTCEVLRSRLRHGPACRCSRLPKPLRCQTGSFAHDPQLFPSHVLAHHHVASKGAEAAIGTGDHA